jgi:hypothetical protein
LIVFLVITGSCWIMANLNANMAPMPSMCSAKARRSEAELGNVTPPHNRLRFAQDIDVPDSRRLC